MDPANLPVATTPKPEIDTLILDTGPIIKNLCTPQSLLSKAGNLITLPAVVSEIRDATTRSQFDTLWSPFLRYRHPKPESIKFVADFAKKTGDYGVLGATDLQVLGLTYEIECEKLGGVDEFAKRLNEKEETKLKLPAESAKGRRGRGRGKGKGQSSNTTASRDDNSSVTEEENGWTTIPVSRGRRNLTAPGSAMQTPNSTGDVGGSRPPSSETTASELLENEAIVVSDSEDDWITPENLNSHLTSDGTTSAHSTSSVQIATACCTTDFAMQNVLLQLHIHLFSPTTMSRITSVKSHVLRCHACFKISRDMTRQFCPSCGQPALTKVTCSTDSKGVFRVHLKKNWQWNNRGNVFSMSKPQQGTASMKGVRENIVLSEDQKEYEKAVKESKKAKERDLMDRDYLPGLLTGERLGHGGSPKIGAGRNVNASNRRVR